MFDLAADQITSLALYGSVVLVVFFLARVISLTRVVALTLAAMPVIVAWLLTNPATHGLLTGMIGPS